MDMKEEDIGFTIANAFRIKVKSAKARGKKLPRDVLVMFNSMDIRNEILRLNYNKNLHIDGKAIIIFKEIPFRFLRRRDVYKQLVSQLKKNGIQHRWEFPEGISFCYKEKRFKLSSPQDLEKFARRYDKELGKVEKIRPVGEQQEEERREEEEEEEEEDEGEEEEEETNSKEYQI